MAKHWDTLVRLCAERHVISTADAARHGVERHALARYARDGRLVRVGRGRFALGQMVRNEPVATAFRHVVSVAPHAFFCGPTAAHLHGLISDLPPKLWAGVARGKWTSKIEGVEWHSFSNNRAELFIDGDEETYRISSPERAIAELFYFSSKLPPLMPEIALEHYLSTHDGGLLAAPAKLFNVLPRIELAMDHPLAPEQITTLRLNPDGMTFPMMPHPLRTSGKGPRTRVQVASRVSGLSSLNNDTFDRAHLARYVAINMLPHCAGASCAVLAVGPGSAEVAKGVARFLDAPVAILATRPLTLPSGELVGAVAEFGGLAFERETVKKLRISQRTLTSLSIEGHGALRLESQRLRARQPLPKLTDRVVILVQDAADSGSAMAAAATLARAHEPHWLIAVIGVATSSALKALKGAVNELHCACQVSDPTAAPGCLSNLFPAVSLDDALALLSPEPDQSVSAAPG